VGAVVTLALGLGYACVGFAPPEFRRARVCFIGSAALLGGMEVVWYAQTGYSFMWRVLVASLICLTIGIGLPETLRWVHKRELYASSVPQPKPEPEQTPPTDNIDKEKPATPPERTKIPPKQHTPPVTQRLPDVSLRFVYSQAPALVIENRSDALARQIKWMVILWNLDLPDRMDPLPIPVQTYDWIRPHDEGGPQDLFANPQVASLLKPGNRLLGSASVICPDCSRGRTYVVSIVWGEGGWFSEVENEKSGKILIPTSFRKEILEAYFKQLLEMTPDKSRIKIGGLEGLSAH
jgi:hypothetical protein